MMASLGYLRHFSDIFNHLSVKNNLFDKLIVDTYCPQNSLNDMI